MEWLPSLEEERKLDIWFTGLDTDPQNGQVGGAKIVKFLMESGLEKAVLRSIWELVDSEKNGWVNKVQFMLIIMRLVSIAYSGQEPSMDKYRATINNSHSYTLPPLSLSVVSSAPTPGASTSETTTSNVCAGASGVNTPVSASTSAITTPMGTLLSPEGASLFGSPHGVPSAPTEWIPTPVEAATLDAWYSSLDENRVQQVGGAKIVGFY